MSGPLFAPRSTTSIAADEPTKTLLYSHHGFGKTWQCRSYERRYGKGFIISGEGGLLSLSDTDIDFLPFTSWDGENDPAKGVYSFKGIVALIATPEFKAKGYKWLAIDSLTEMSNQLMAHLEADHAARGEKNGFAIWGEYSSTMLGALRWVRNFPMHVYVTALAKEEKDGNGDTHYWPMVKGQSVAKEIPGLFDFVFCGARTTKTDSSGEPRVSRYFITEETSGWHGKTRDPRHRLKTFEDGADITELLARVAMSTTAYDAVMKAKAGVSAAPVAATATSADEKEAA